MASMWDKMKDLEAQLHVVRIRLGEAERSQSYPDFEVAMSTVLNADRLLKAVRSTVRAKARNAKARLQAICKHENRAATRTRFNYETKASVTEFEACTACKKVFDLREKVS
jgi:hypothetical protein